MKKLLPIIVLLISSYAYAVPNGNGPAGSGGGGGSSTASTLSDDIPCAANQSTRRNGTDTGWECFTAATGAAATNLDQSAGETDLRYDATPETYYVDINGDSVRDNGEQQFPTQIKYAVDYAIGSTTGGIQEAINSCGEGSTTDDQGCLIYIPKGTTTITTTIEIGGTGLSTLQSGISLVGDGAGTESSGGDKLAGSTLVWGGANGGTMILVQGFHHFFSDFMLDGNNQAGYGIRTTGDNGDSVPTGKGTITRIAIEDILDTAHGNKGIAIAFDGGTQTAQNITALNNSTPRNVTITAHGFVNGNKVWIIGTSTELDNQYWRVANATANTFDLAGSVPGTAWAAGGTGALIDEGQNDHWLVQQVRIANSRTCIRQNTAQAIQNYVLQFDCGSFTNTGIIVEAGGIAFEELFLGTTTANVIGMQVDSCAAVTSIKNGSMEWQGDNGTVIRHSDGSFGCGTGNRYVHLIDSVRFQMQTTATTEHTCIQHTSRSVLNLTNNIWTSNNSDALRKCDLELDNPDGSQAAYVFMAGNRSAWNNGADLTDVSMTITSTGGAFKGILRNDLGRVEFRDQNGSNAIAKDSTGLFSDTNNNGAKDATEPYLSQIAELNASETITGAWDFATGSLRLPNSTTLPGTCTVGQTYVDIDATSGSRLYVCEATNTWTIQGATILDLADNGVNESTDVDEIATVNDFNSIITNPSAGKILIDGDIPWESAESLRRASDPPGGYLAFSGSDAQFDVNLDSLVDLSIDSVTGRVVFGGVSILNGFQYEGIPNAFEQNFTFTDPTADQDWVVPNISGTNTFISLESAQTITGAKTINSLFNFTSGTLRIPNSVTLPGTCTLGDQYMDTDATTGQRHYLCESSNTWVLQGDGGSGGGAPTGVSYLTLALDATLTAERTVTAGTGIASTDGGANGAFTLSSDLTELTCGVGILCSSATAFSVDTTEITNTTWGSGTGITHTFNAGATDPAVTFGSGSVSWASLTTFTLPSGSSLAVTGGCTLSTLLDCAASSVNGGKVLIREDSDLGSDTWAIDLSQTNLSVPFVITPNSAGLLTATQLLNVATTDRILCRDTSGSGAVEECSTAQLLEMISTVQGRILYRGPTNWTTLATGTAGQVLQTGGTGADPSWRSIPVYKSFIAAGCNVTSAGPGLNIPSVNGPVASCYGVDPHKLGGLDYANGANALTADLNFRLKDWDAGTISIDLTWFCVHGAGTCSTNNVVWKVQTKCVADTEDIDNPTYNAVESITTASSATQYARITSTDSSLDITGCAVGETLFVKIQRDPTDAGDTLTGIASLMEATIKFGAL